PEASGTLGQDALPRLPPGRLLLASNGSTRVWQNRFTLELAEKRRQMPGVIAPAPDRGRVDRISDLARAGGSHDGLCGVESQAAVVPRQTQELNDLANLCLRLRDHLLVVHLKHRDRQDLSPVPHQDLMKPPIGAEMIKVVGK